LGHKESWGVIIASTALDPIWWLFIGWIPIYLNEVFGMNVKEIAFSAWVPYVGAMLGAWFGGLLAQRLLSNKSTVDRTRKFVITLGCIIMIPCFVLLRYPGSPQMLGMFGVSEKDAITMADPQVKKIMDNVAFKDLFKDQDFVNSIAGKSLTEIKANKQFSEAFASAEWPKAKDDASQAERLLPKYGPPNDSGIAALNSLPEILNSRKTSALIAILIMAILLFGFQTAIGNVQTIPSDLFGGKVVGTLSGFAGTGAKLAGAALTAIIPFITQGGNYIPAFLVGGALAAIALFAVWVLVPRIEPIKPTKSQLIKKF
jgi:ACS family hexuronate transporter-like MFS transporter